MIEAGETSISRVGADLRLPAGPFFPAEFRRRFGCAPSAIFRMTSNSKDN